MNKNGKVTIVYVDGKSNNFYGEFASSLYNQILSKMKHQQVVIFEDSHESSYLINTANVAYVYYDKNPKQ